MKSDKALNGGFMVKFLTKNVVPLIALFGGYFVYKKLNTTSKVLTKPIGKILAEIQSF